MREEQEMFELILKIAKEDERVRAVYLYGSRANPNAAKDNYSDYDIAFVVTETSSFIENTNWISNFGDIVIVFESHWNRIQFGLTGESIDFLRRYIWCMLFKDGNRVDLIMETKEEAMKNIFVDNKQTILLLDKDGILPEIPLPNDEDCYAKKPDKDKYKACCNAFWWFLNDVAKGIARDQLPYAKEQFNSLVRYTLNQMTDWYIGVQTHFSVSPGKKGRYYKKYLPKDIYDLYTKTYSDSNYTNFWNAIFSSCELFKKLTSSVGDYFGFVYNHQEENNMMDYLIKMKNETL